MGPAAEPVAVQGLRRIHATEGLSRGADPARRRGSWRAHLAATLAANPGLIPVVKGNGYGFGLDLLVAECARLHGSAGVGMIAVGTYAEAPVALAAFPGDVLVMEPYRPVIHALPHLGDGALVHTITHGPDLDDLAGRVGRPRVVVEGSPR